MLGFLDLSFCILNFSSTVLVKINALLIIEVDYINFVRWPRAGGVFQRILSYQM